MSTSNQTFQSVREQTSLPASGRLVIFNKGKIKENGAETDAPIGTLVTGTLENVKVGEKYKNKTYSIRSQGTDGMEDGTLVLIDAPKSLEKLMKNVQVGDLIKVQYDGTGILKSGDYAGNMFYKFDVLRAVDAE